MFFFIKLFPLYKTLQKEKLCNTITRTKLAKSMFFNLKKT